MSSRRTLLLTAVLTALLPHPGWAADPRPLEVDFRVDRDRLEADVDVSPAFDADAESQLTSGLTNRVQIVLSVHVVTGEGEVREGAVAVFVRECQVVYDLWGERFGLRLTEGGVTTERLVETYAQVVAACARFEHVPLAPVGRFDLRRRYLLQARVAVNPDDEVAAEDEETDYVGDPIGHRRGGEQGATLFGAMAQLFVRDGAEDDGEGRLFRTAPFGEKTIRLALRHARPPTAEAPGTGGEEEEE